MIATDSGVTKLHNPIENLPCHHHYHSTIAARHPTPERKEIIKFFGLSAIGFEVHKIVDI